MVRRETVRRGVAAVARMLTARALLSVATVCVLLEAGPSSAAFQQRYTYRAQDRTYGAIGTYSNTVEKSGDATTIATEAHIKVSILGIIVYRQDVSRIERQVGNRLVYFHGITTENDEPIEVDGRAEGEHFVITSPSGKVTVPGTIRSVNPWSAGIPGADMVLMPDTGLVVKVHASGGEETSITIDGASMQVRRYQIDTVDGRERYEVWMDNQATPVMFSIQDRESSVTFTLVR